MWIENILIKIRAYCPKSNNYIVSMRISGKRKDTQDRPVRLEKLGRWTASRAGRPAQSMPSGSRVRFCSPRHVAPTSTRAMYKKRRPVLWSFDAKTSWDTYFMRRAKYAPRSKCVACSPLKLQSKPCESMNHVARWQVAKGI